MNLNEAAELLRFSREEVKIAVEKGIALPKSKEVICLSAHTISDNYDIDEESLDEFIKRFHDEEPGRHPPVNVRRELLIEARHGCAVCEDVTIIEFHHIIEYSKARHYDVRHMLAMCPNHHVMCTKGMIDQKAQYEYKRRLLERTTVRDGTQFLHTIGPARFSWDDLREIIIALHESVAANASNGTSKYDFQEIDIARKNEINRVGDDYYNTVIVRHEPYFRRIRRFLEDPTNTAVVELYYQIVDELQSKIALSRDEHERFEYFMSTFADIAVMDQVGGRSQNRRTISILMSFMYVNCDIGRKQ